MKKLIIPLFGTLLLAGCGGSDSGSSVVPDAQLKKNCSAINAQTVVDLIEKARAKPRRCVNKEATPQTTNYSASKNKLQWDNNLEKFAVYRSKDMAQKNEFKHIPTGEFRQKVYEFGYADSFDVFENIGVSNGTNLTVPTIIDGWLASNKGHCDAIMNPNITDIALACHFDADSKHKSFWTLALAYKK